VNSDGTLDVVTGNEFSSDISVLFGLGDGGFQTQQRFAVGIRPESIALGDVSGDSAIDLVVADSRDISVLFGHGDGGFQRLLHFAVGDSTSRLALGDVNSDGLLDLVVSIPYSIYVLLGHGD
jgi:hypothetical protein